jgi:predicted transcriptional regulator
MANERDQPTTENVLMPVRLPADLKTRIQSYAKRHGYTGNAVAITFLADSIDRAEVEDRRRAAEQAQA